MTDSRNTYALELYGSVPQSAVDAVMDNVGATRLKDGKYFMNDTAASLARVLLQDRGIRF